MTTPTKTAATELNRAQCCAILTRRGVIDADDAMQDFNIIELRAKVAASAPATERASANQQQARRVRMNIACYDNGGETADRYTVVYLDEPEREPGVFACVGMSDSPFHPQGFGQHSTAMLGAHLGKRIKFWQLPDDCRKLVRRDMGVIA